MCVCVWTGCLVVGDWSVSVDIFVAGVVASWGRPGAANTEENAAIQKKARIINVSVGVRDSKAFDAN